MSAQVKRLYEQVKKTEDLVRQVEELRDFWRNRLAEEVREYGDEGYTLEDGTKLNHVSEGWAPDYAELLTEMGVNTYGLRRQFVKPTYDYAKMAKSLLGRDVAFEMSREFGLGKKRAGGLRVVTP